MNTHHKGLVSIIPALQCNNPVSYLKFPAGTNRLSIQLYHKNDIQNEDGNAYANHSRNKQISKPDHRFQPDGPDLPSGKTPSPDKC